MVHQHGTNRKQVRSDGRLGVVCLMTSHNIAQHRKVDQELEQETGAEGEVGGVPLIITPPSRQAWTQCEGERNRMERD